MQVVSTERARELANNILPLPQLRGWLKRVTPRGLEVDACINAFQFVRLVDTNWPRTIGVRISYKL